MLKIETLADAIGWILDHRGRSETQWDNQWRWNARYEERQREQEKRIQALEKRVVLMASGFAALGAASPYIMKALFGAD